MKKFTATIPAGSGISFDNSNRDIGLQHITFEAFVVEEVDTRAFVQVSTTEGNSTRLSTRLWTYEDPTGGGLEIGDEVIVPFGYTNMKLFGVVKAFGLGSCPRDANIKKVGSYVAERVILPNA